jgi:hypothetical protein
MTTPYFNYAEKVSRAYIYWATQDCSPEVAARSWGVSLKALLQKIQDEGGKV